LNFYQKNRFNFRVFHQESKSPREACPPKPPTVKELLVANVSKIIIPNLARVNYQGLLGKKVLE